MHYGEKKILGRGNKKGNASKERRRSQMPMRSTWMSLERMIRNDVREKGVDSLVLVLHEMGTIGRSGVEV